MRESRAGNSPASCYPYRRPILYHLSQTVIILFHMWKSLTRERFIEITIDGNGIPQSVKVAGARWPRQVTKSFRNVSHRRRYASLQRYAYVRGSLWNDREDFSPSVFILSCRICSQRCSQSCPTHRSCTTTDKCCWSVPNSWTLKSCVPVGWETSISWVS